MAGIDIDGTHQKSTAAVRAIYYMYLLVSDIKNWMSAPKVVAQPMPRTETSIIVLDFWSICLKMCLAVNEISILKQFNNIYTTLNLIGDLSTAISWKWTSAWIWLLWHSIQPKAKQKFDAD